MTRGDIRKASCDNLMIVLKSGVPYFNTVTLKIPLDFIDKAPHPKYWSYEVHKKVSEYRP
jgi:hypothetical protein